MKYRKTIEGRIALRIARKQSPVLLREDFDDLGGYDQVGRALLALTRKGKLVKIGYGLYAKAKVSSQTGNTVPTTDYQEGRSAQVPTGRLISVSKRISRKIAFNNIAVSYERSSR